MGYKFGQNCIISGNSNISDDVIIGNNCIIEDDVTIEDGVYIDSNIIIRAGAHIGQGSAIGANCIIGEYQSDFYNDRKKHFHELFIGANSIIRSGTIIYSGSTIGDNFQTGHNVTVREDTIIGNHVSLGTLSDIQNHCTLGNYVRLHSNVFVPKLTQIDDCVWIFPHVVFTNDPTPPSENEIGAHVHSFSIISARALILPGVEIFGDSLVAAGAVVTKDVMEYSIVKGNPATYCGDVREIKNKVTKNPVYPWRYYFDRAMPWNGVGFDEWYESLDEEYKSMLQIP